MAHYAFTAALTGLNLIQQRNQQKAQAQLTRQQADNDLARRRQALDMRNRQRQNVLKKQLASRRAAFGASGLGGRGGSADAVFQGLRNETERAIGDDERSLDLTAHAINDKAAFTARRNLLTRRNFLQRSAMDAAFRKLKKTSLLDQ